VGDFELKFENHSEAVDIPEIPPIPAEEAPLAAVEAKPKKKKKSGSANDGPPCPSCEQLVARGGKFCIDCGINIETGRPLLTAHGVDEDEFHNKAAMWIKGISYFIPLNIMPIPIASEAYGTRKPYAIWGIAAVTVLASLAFFIYSFTDDYGRGKAKEFMLWAPNAAKAEVIQLTPSERREILRELKDDPEARAQLEKKVEELRGKVPEKDLQKEAIKAFVVQKMREDGYDTSPGEFHWWQLITHAFLHDTSSVWGFIMHLAGNLVFLIVFGGRVNALIGHVATLIVYPILAVGAAFVHLWSENFTGSGPMLGASGAIMGLAGMYLILFPVHRVYCAIWIHLYTRFFRTILFGLKILKLRGFWVLLIYFAYDILMQVLETKVFNKGGAGGVAHWAHIGGFILGMMMALGILFSRMFNCRGGDLLSVVLGKGAWPLIGKPSRWREAQGFAQPA
jgi:rhomboid family protein